MSKFNSKKLAPIVKKVGTSLTKAGKLGVKVIKDRHFQEGVLTAVIPTAFLVRKYKKDAEKKEKQYMDALKKHNAIIKALSVEAEMDTERINRLLSCDSELKNEMRGLQSEIKDLKEKVAEFEKKGENNA